ncbi:bifunctional diguanylate cyclase/phosphodiesterase [Methylomonas sp. EFPC1]|uniref:Bifunctional diguanylate cyclase/phosphodiesterase n=1 Tax=Methylomonas defluvii TaxID=3045149 RepID=A0ABU4UD03_9GAMM|nr:MULTISPECIES: bifunctional diguanylate cyclase/phosphodiesterase [unclassified Methylomonas]MDX8126599.1 bifunctional diguanylate cyclase/phosphodiesterase [Methylomonas sp. OY6]NOV29289.1 bifunctional diguanylate cyclase/phosphodiesterase [Methylomonas sp. ZR1]PKD39719.1 GGDEF-domain containing protein [Methylomonas sp. Kb3]QSB03278.1 bifunctional diguanylate cyclase/phosphodiesterase [Methylomonas sp. EFPC1]
MIPAKNILNENVRVLKSEVSKTTYQGVAIAIASILSALLALSYYYVGEISLNGIIKAQTENYGLWMLEALPFIFGFWGQYSSSVIAYQAGAMILDQTQELRSRAESLEKQVSYSTTHDSVTDLPNRVLFYDRVEQAMLAAGNQNKMLSILLVEVANFKEVYDTLGRNSSDLILKQIATRLQSVVLGTDSVARIDGNIFSVLLSAVDNETAGLTLAKNIQAALDPAFKVERLSLVIHSNIGIVNFPEHGDDVDTLVQKAGVALFVAGQSHEGYTTYAPSYDDHSPRRLTLMSELRQAIEKEQLHVYYQPKVSVQTGQVYGAEALVRWQHPKHGFIAPDEFIPMAERTRVIKHLTAWMLKQSFKHCAEWRKRGWELIISVNLSAKDLHDPELPDVMAGVAAAANIKPGWMMLEITESSIMTDPERAMEVIQRLNEMGYKLSIDDFGTGYSSLAYLKRMPLTELKIDKSFVVDLLHSENDAVIVKATINLAHNLGLQVTAEGVETQEIIEKLSTYRCDLAQGYLFSKPMPFEAFGAWVEAHR